MERAGRLIRGLKLPSDSVSPGELACAAWPLAVGGYIAGRTHPLELIRERLVVEVEDRIWQRQLWSLRSQILSQIAKVLGDGLVGELEFRIRAPRIPPQREERAAAPARDGDQIADPILRRLYKSARARELA